MNRIVISLLILVSLMTTNCRGQEPAPTQTPIQPSLFTTEVIDENTLSPQIRQQLAALRQDTTTIAVGVRRLALPNAAKMLDLSSVIVNIDSTRIYTIGREKLQRTMFIQQKGLWWYGAIRTPQFAITTDCSMYLEESPISQGGYKFRNCKVNDFNAPGRYFFIAPLNAAQDLWYVAAIDPTKFNYNVGD